jgi:hypothetical protein
MPYVCQGLCIIFIEIVYIGDGIDKDQSDGGFLREKLRAFIDVSPLS